MSTSTFAIRYAVDNKTEVLYPKLSLTHSQVQVELGRIIYKALREGRKLQYLRVVPCVKRPGTKVLAELSRRTMTEDQLRHACKVYHSKAYPQA
jgi:hypothetical protein